MTIVIIIKLILLYKCNHCYYSNNIIIVTIFIIVPQYGARLSIHNLNYWTLKSVVLVLWLGYVWNFECNIVHRRSVAVLWILYKIRYNMMHEPHLRCRMCHCELYAHRCFYAPPRCRTSQYRRNFILISVSLWNNLSHPVFDGVGPEGFKSKVNVVLLA